MSAGRRACVGVVALAAALAGTGCTADDPASTGAATSVAQPPIIDLSASTAPPLAGVLTLAQRHGADSQSVLGMRGDGLAVLARGPRPHTDVSLVDGVGVVDVRDVDRGTIRWAVRPPTRAIEGPEPWLGDISDRWMAWAEGASTELTTLDAAFWAAPLDDVAHPRRVGHSAQFTDKHVSSPPIGYYRPTIVGDRLVWADARAFSTEEKVRHPGFAYGMSLYTHRLDGRGVTQEEAHGGYLPGRDQCAPAPTTTLTYARTSTSEGTLPAGTIEVYRRVGTSAPQRLWAGRLPNGARLDDVAVCADVVAVLARLPDSADGKNWTWLALVDHGRVTQEQRFEDALASDLALTRRYLALTAGTSGQERTYLLDRGSRRTFALEPDAAGCSEVILHDASVLWGARSANDAQDCVTKVATLK